MKLTNLLLAGLIGLTGCSPKVIQKEVRMIELQNPILPGYFADPSLVQYDGKFYMYVTADPWGTDFLSCWVSDDFQNWTFRTLNWPTKAACTTSLSETRYGHLQSFKKGTLFICMSLSGLKCGVGKQNIRWDHGRMHWATSL